MNKRLYYEINPMLAANARILRIGEDLGIWDLMLTLQQAKRRVTTYIENDALRNIAKQSYLLQKRRIQYIEEISLTNTRSEEHTSELQSRPHLVCRLLL